jgi:hypothetical protein
MLTIFLNKQMRPIIKFETTFEVSHNVKFIFIVIKIVKAGIKIVLSQCSYSFRQFVILMICRHAKFSVPSYISSWVMKLNGSKLSVPVCYIFCKMKWLTRLIVLKIYLLQKFRILCWVLQFLFSLQCSYATLVVLNRYEKAWFHMKLLVNIFLLCQIMLWWVLTS